MSKSFSANLKEIANQLDDFGRRMQEASEAMGGLGMMAADVYATRKLWYEKIPIIGERIWIKRVRLYCEARYKECGGVDAERVRLHFEGGTGIDE